MITKHLQECIPLVPVGKWFTYEDLPIQLNRRSWICDRLEQEGILKSKCEWVVDHKKGMTGRTDFRTIKFYYLIPVKKHEHI